MTVRALDLGTLTSKRRRLARSLWDGSSLPSDLSRAHCVRTATLVAPRVAPAASPKRTNTRLVAGSKGTVAVPVMKMPNVGVSPPLICVVTLGALMLPALRCAGVQPEHAGPAAADHGPVAAADDDIAGGGSIGDGA